MEAFVKKDMFGKTEEVTIRLGGDWELSVFVQALEFAVKTLNEHASWA